MFNKALTQMFQDVNWGEVDYCIIDMPPGTGDAQLSLSQMVKLAGAVVVTTPQEVALADVRKAVSMLKKVNVDVLGVVENMSGFATPDGTIHPIFGVDGGKALARSLGVPLLACLPIDIAIREGGDAGIPAAANPATPAGRTFAQLALQLIEILDSKAGAESQLKVIN